LGASLVQVRFALLLDNPAQPVCWRHKAAQPYLEDIDMNTITIKAGNNTVQVSETAYAEHLAHFRKIWSLEEDFDGCLRAERLVFEALLIEELQISEAVLRDMEAGA
jgi:hypothetical protein